MIKNILNFLFLFLCAFFISACQTQVGEEIPTAATPQSEVLNDEDGCSQEGGILKFDLKSNLVSEIPTFPHDTRISSFVFLGPIPSYSLDRDCMCYLSEYRLYFDSPPNPQELTLYNQVGNEIAYSGPIVGDSNLPWYVEVSGFNLNQSLYVGFDHNTDPLPNLIHAGGLCMIDNVSLPKNPGIISSPYIREVLDENELFLGFDIFLPASHGTPSVAPHF